jgi:hypothetical protein
MEGMLDGVGLWKERKEWEEHGGMLDGVGLWKESKECEEEGRNAGQFRVVEGKKGMGGRSKECWRV